MSGGSAITLALSTMSLRAATSSRDGGGLGGLGIGGGGAGGLGGLSFITASRFKVHPPQQVLEARVVAEASNVNCWLVLGVLDPHCG